MNTACNNWLNSMTWQASFYGRSRQSGRKDPEFDWTWFERHGSGPLAYLKNFIRLGLKSAGLRQRGPLSVDWIHENVDALWSTRCMLSDDLSRLLFDSALVVRIVDHRHFYYPRIDFDDLVDVKSVRPFESSQLPQDYLGVPLKIFEVNIRERLDIPPLKMLTTDLQLRLLNSYRQYLIRRAGSDVSPSAGDVVLDCGACIGEVSLLFAGLVGQSGAVHLFDPIPLHIRYCALQAAQNPNLASVIHLNALAISDCTRTAPSEAPDLERINPGNFSLDDFSTTTIDDYASANLERVDFIKMDIEGAELAALSGAAKVIGRYKPTLAISGYHKPEDLWELPNKIKSLNPDYVLSFGHHSPVSWESVFYAKDPFKASPP